jgi:hypothetical protein
MNLEKFESLLTLPSKTYLKVIDYINNEQDLTEEDLDAIQLYAKDLCCINMIDDRVKPKIQDLYNILNSQYFDKVIQNLDIERKNQDLFNQLVIIRLILQNIIEEDKVLISYLFTIEAGLAKLLQLTYQSITNKELCQIPENIIDALQEEQNYYYCKNK